MRSIVQCTFIAVLSEHVVQLCMQVYLNMYATAIMCTCVITIRCPDNPQ